MQHIDKDTYYLVFKGVELNKLMLTQSVVDAAVKAHINCFEAEALRIAVDISTDLGVLTISADHANKCPRSLDDIKLIGDAVFTLLTVGLTERMIKDEYYNVFDQNAQLNADSGYDDKCKALAQTVLEMYSIAKEAYDVHEQKINELMESWIHGLA